MMNLFKFVGFVRMNQIGTAKRLGSFTIQSFLVMTMCSKGGVSIRAGFEASNFIDTTMIPRLVQISQILSLVMHNKVSARIVIPTMDTMSNYEDGYKTMGFQRDSTSTETSIVLRAKELIRVPHYHTQHSFVKY